MRRIVLLVLAAGLLGWYSWQIVNFQRVQTHLVDRALLVICDNANYPDPQVNDFYAKNREKILPVISELFRVNEEELGKSDATEIIDKYGDAWLGRQLLSEANGYGTKVLLSHDKASLQEVKNEITNLNKQGYVLDIIFLAHTNSEVVFLNNQTISYEEMYRELNPITLNLGFVYLAAGYGPAQVEMWKNLGATAVCGPAVINDLPIIAPGEFLKEWVKGASYEQAVNYGTAREIKFWKTVSQVMPEAKIFLSEEAISGSRMIFGGNKALTI
jgi:hypothetical protein